MSLPPPQPSQPYFDVSVIEAGNVLLREHIFVKGGSPTKATWTPSLSFLLIHSQSNKRILFDLGVRKDWDAYPPATVQYITDTKNIRVPIDAVESLRRGALQPDDIDIIILSHVHYDHIGDPSLFPHSQFVVGADSKELLAAGYSADDQQPAHDARFAKHLLPESRTSYLATQDWKPLGPFPLVHDFFGDGSLYLIDAAGHLQGHINALVRTSTDGGWLYLAGDSAHDVRLLTGEREIGMYPHRVTGDLVCIHHDIEAAKMHLGRIRDLYTTNPRVLVLLAHGHEWFNENREKGVVFPGKIDSLKGQA